jgi:hypothetical protein
MSIVWGVSVFQGVASTTRSYLHKADNSWVVYSCLTGHGILSLLWNRKVHFTVYKNSPIRQMNPIHIHTSHILRSILILSS